MANASNENRNFNSRTALGDDNMVTIVECRLRHGRVAWPLRLLNFLLNLDSKLERLMNAPTRSLVSLFPAVAAAALCVLASGALAQTASALVNPGAWDVTPQNNAGASVSYRLCFARGDLEDLKQLLPNLSNSADCPVMRVEAADGVMTWEFACPAKSFRGDARYALSATAIQGTVNFTQGTPAATTSQSIAAKYSGACPAR